MLHKYNRSYRFDELDLVDVDRFPIIMDFDKVTILDIWERGVGFYERWEIMNLIKSKNLILTTLRELTSSRVKSARNV